MKQTSIILVVSLMLPLVVLAQNVVTINSSGYDTECGTKITTQENGLIAKWNFNENESGSLLLNFEKGRPLIQQLSVANKSTGQISTVAKNLDIAFVLTVGERDLEKRNGWTIFFDKTHHKPYDSYTADLSISHVKVSSEGKRCSITIDSLKAGPFSGSLVLTVYANSPLIHVEGVVETNQNAKAIVYDAGLVSATAEWEKIAWLGADGVFQNQSVEGNEEAKTPKVRHRTIIAQGTEGSIAVFPAPHQYFYPLDFSENYKFTWYGKNYRHKLDDFGLGIRLPLDGDKRWVPWFNAPPNTQQRLGFFLLASSKEAKSTLEQVKKYTRKDQFKKLPGHTSFSSHYHVEHTKDLVNQQPNPENWDPDRIVIPESLQEPGFVKVLKDMKVDIVHLAEFHFGKTRGLQAKDRLPLLKLMHNECERLSDDSFLLLPGEEPNVHLGGHWISFFPKPVYWVLNNREKKPFVEHDERYGKVYHLGSPEQTLEFFKKEGGLMWTAHPRIKGSTGFPDNYNQTNFYLSEQFLGGAWKNMPVDLSHDRLGNRVLNLEDDMANWGKKKYILGEVDVFQINPDHELYAHMNINYLRMDNIPKFSDGWQPVLDVLRNGSYFTTTGEVLINEFSVNGKLSGETQKAKKKAKITVKLEWTFPMNFIEIISGDGQNVYRERIDLSKTESFATGQWVYELDLSGRKWVRMEAWDIAKNGAFTPPVWLE